MSRVVGAGGGGGGGPTSLAGRSRHRSPTRDAQPFAGSLRRSLGSSASAPSLLPGPAASAVAFGAARAHSPPRVHPRKQADLPSPVLARPELFSVFVDTHYVPPSTMPTAPPSIIEWDISQQQAMQHAAPKAHAKHVSKSDRLKALGRSQSAATLPPLSPAAASAAASGSATTPASPALASPKANRASGSAAASGMVSPSSRGSVDGSSNSRSVSAGSRAPFTTSSVRPSARLRAARSQLVLSPLGGSGSSAPPIVAPSALEQGSTYISPTYTFTSGRQADGSYERWFDLQAYESYKRTGVKMPPRERPPNPPRLPRAGGPEECKEEHPHSQGGGMIEISDEQLTAAMHQQLQQEQHLQAMVDKLRANQEDHSSDDPLHRMQYAPRSGADADGKPPARRRPQAQEDEDSPHDSERDEEIDNWDDDDDEGPEGRDTIKEEGEGEGEGYDKFDQATYDDLTLSALRSAATDRSVKDLDAVRTRARMERRRARRKKEEEARAASALNGGLGGGGPGSVSFLTLPGAPLIAMSGLPVAGTSGGAGLGGGGGGGYTSRQMSRRVSTVGVTFSPATFDTYDEDVKQGMESVAEIYPHNQAQHSSVSHVQRLTAVEQQKREEKERLKALQVKRRARRRQAAEDQVREIFGDAWYLVQADRIPDDAVALSSKSAKALAAMRRLQAKAKRAFTSATLTIHNNHATNYRVHPAIKPLNFFRILPDRPAQQQTVIDLVPSGKGGASSILPNGAMTSTGSGGTTYKNDGSLSALGAGPPSPLPKQGGSQAFRSAAKQVAQALAFAGPSGALTATSMGGSPEKMPPSTARGGGAGGDRTTRPGLLAQLSSATLMPPQTGRTGRSLLGVPAGSDSEQSASGSLLRAPQGSPGRSFSPSPTLSDRRGSQTLSERAAAEATERAMTLQPQTGKFLPHAHAGRAIPMGSLLGATKPHTLAPGGTVVNLNKDSDEESSEAESEELSEEDGPLQSDTPPLLPLPAPLLPPAAAALLAPPAKPEPPPAPVPLSSPSWPLGPPQARREEELETLVAAATRSYALTTWLHKHGKHGLGGGGAAGVALDPALAHRYHDAFKTLDASASGEITAETIAAALRRTHNLHLPAEELEVLLCKLKLAGNYSLAGTNAAAAAKARRAKAFAGVSDAMLSASNSKHGVKEQIQQAAFVSALATTSEWEALLDVWRARKAQAAAAAGAAGATPSTSTSPERHSPPQQHVSMAPSHTRRSSLASTGSQPPHPPPAHHHRSNSPPTLLPFLLWIPAFQRLQLIEAAMELSRGTGGAPGVLSETQLHPPAHAPAHERERASVLRAKEVAIQARFERLLRKMHMPSGSTLTELWQATRSQVRKELEDQAAGRFDDSDDVSVSESDDSDDSWFDGALEDGGAGDGEGGSESARILASPKACYEGMLEGTAVAASKVVDLTENADTGASGSGSAMHSSPTSPLGRTLSSGSLLAMSGPAGRGSLVTSGSRRNLHRLPSASNSQASTHRGGGSTRRQRALGGAMLPSSTPFGPTTINSLAPPVVLVGVMSKMKQRGLDTESVAIAQAEKRMAAEHARIATEEHAARIQAQRERDALEQDAADRAARALEEAEEDEATIDGVDLSTDPVDEAEFDELASIKILRSPVPAGQSRRALDWTSTVLPRRLGPLLSRPGTAGGNTPRTPEVPSPLQRPKALLASSSSPSPSPKASAGTAASSQLESSPHVFQIHVHSPKSASAAAVATSAGVSPTASASTTASNKLYRRGSGGDLDALHATLAASAAAAAAAAAAASASATSESPFEVLLQFTWIGAGDPVSLPALKPEAGWKRLPLPAVRTAHRDLIVCSFSFRSLARARNGKGQGEANNSPSLGSRQHALVARRGRADGVLAPLSRLPSSSRALQHSSPLRGSRRTLSALQEVDGDGSTLAPIDDDDDDGAPSRHLHNSSPQRRALKSGEHLLTFVVNPLVQLYKTNDRSLIVDVSQLELQSRGHAGMLEGSDEMLYVTPQLQFEE